MADERGPYATTAAMRRRYALHLLTQAGNAAPVQHPLQAMARALQGAMGGYAMGQLMKEDEAERQRADEDRERAKAVDDALTRPPPRTPSPLPPPDAPPPDAPPPAVREARLLSRRA